MIDASLNEVEGLAGRAARGAGLAWGMAEEVGKAARWIAACGLDWAPSLVTLLRDEVELAPPHLPLAQPWRAAPPAVALSPIATGSLLADLGEAAGEIELGPCAHPLWLLPFAAHAAAAIHAAVVVGWEDVSVTVWPYGGDVAGDPAALKAALARRVSWVPLQPGTVAVQPVETLGRAGRSRVGPDAWQALATIGARTYVPASAQSRSAGAGAGNIDND